MENSMSPGPLPSYFPAHDGPRVWVVSAGSSPIGISLARQLIAHGDIVIAGISGLDPEQGDPRSADFKAFLDELSFHNPKLRERMKPVVVDIRMMNECQAIIAEAISAFGRVDVLICCSSQAIIGTVEELAASERTQRLVKDQFETNYFGPVNLIKAVLPQLRRQKFGHIIVVGGITGHIGTPGLGVYCAAGWALEGFCDSLAYEIAPFNIRLTILQCSIEIGILTNLITSVPPILPAYSPSTNHAPLFRNIMNGLLSRLPNFRQQYGQSLEPTQTVAFCSPTSPAVSTTSSTNTNADTNPNAYATSDTSTDNNPDPGQQAEEAAGDDEELTGSHQPLSAPTVVSLYPPLSPLHLDVLMSETIHAITAIGGHENPPARHIVGAEGSAAVKEKLKTVTEELEDFIDCSSAVDIHYNSDVGGGSGSTIGRGGKDSTEEGGFEFL
ncbi:short chain dehydrogenase/reductase family protein [Paracoccidioides lutzii Pb01]|uniref:Short chain dehydrogenase/reductase family protein n=1 Tax=Paracoccidioides lutzii (strain ATCC MYA-826 / Pb01) TaxID=502779 RepID=C1H1G3_PARBA|nr:short chain dehydrogenase/reductase family protein [Paracoccidioides lutzii Pb01]EEH33557.2 short chain dehydrogenase/reductase family protein [Paracoccidioides lutzii Pb01]